MAEYFIRFYVELKYGYLGLLTNYIVALFIPVLLENVDFRSPKKLLLLLAKMVGSAALMQLLCSVDYMLFADKAMSQICGGALLVLYLLLLCRYKKTAKITMGVSYFSIISLVLVICFSMADILNASELTDLGDMQWALLCMVIALFAGCTMFFKAFSIHRLGDVSAVSVAMICAVGAASVLFWILTNAVDIPAPAGAVLSIVLLTLLLISYYSAYAISRSFSENNKKRAEMMLRETDESMLRMSESNLESLHKLRHELKNQYTYMKVLLDNKEYGKLDAYFAEYADKLMESLSFADCGNGVINAIINIELSKAAQSGITIEHSVAVPSELKFADIDLCSLLLNLINNAIEYLERNKCLTDKVIRAEIRLINKTLLITVSNPIKTKHRESALTLLTSKRDKSMHGYGSKVVRSIVNAYNGSINYETIGDRFVASAILSETADAGGERKKSR